MPSIAPTPAIVPPGPFHRKMRIVGCVPPLAPDKVGELIKVFNEISAELKNHYLLAYTPIREADGSWREISLKVSRPDAEVRVRKGYFSLKRRRSAD